MHYNIQSSSSRWCLVGRMDDDEDYDYEALTREYEAVLAQKEQEKEENEFRLALEEQKAAEQLHQATNEEDEDMERLDLKNNYTAEVYDSRKKAEGRAFCANTSRGGERGGNSALSFEQRSRLLRVVVWLFLLFSQRRGEASHGEAASTNTNTFTGRERRRPWRCIRGEDDAQGERIRRE